MKFMKLGTRPDTFYTEEATRAIISDLPSNLTIRVNNISYLLHKFPLLPKCGLLQRLCSDTGDSSNVTLELHDIPGGEDAFELCAKFCYGITINISAHNFVPAFCAAKFLRMTEAVEKGNFVLKLEAFFSSCILEGWKDLIATLQTTGRLPEWSENLGIIRRCIDSVVEKILTPPAKVTWSYTYTRPGYTQKRHQYVPKDWWTEDMAELHIDLFRCIVTTVRSTNMLPPQLIGEALHVYACHWLPEITKNKPPPHPLAESSASQAEENVGRKRQVLETIVSMIPSDRGSVSVGFLLRLLSTANIVGVSPVTKTELIKRSSVQFEEATLADLLLLPSHSSDDLHFYDVDLVGIILESFLMQQRRQPSSGEHNQSVRKVGKLIDSYLQVAATDVNMPVQKMVSLAEALPASARPEHNDLYKAINIYLKEHPDLDKAEKKNLCRILDCQKLSPEVCAHVVRNERLPLRTVVQVLFFEHERGARSTSKQQTPITTQDDLSKLKIGPDNQGGKEEGMRETTTSGIIEKGHHKLRKSGAKLQLEPKQNVIKQEESDKGREIREEQTYRSKLEMDPMKIIKRSKSDRGNNRGRERAE